MSFHFNNKIVYVLSPEKWGKMRVSKHHYALELAEGGNKVYFIEPGDLKSKGIQISPSTDHPSLFIISYRPVYRGRRFLPDFIYRILLKWQIQQLKQAIKEGPDVVWCFDPYRFLNLKWFKAPLNIFFGADLFSYDYLPEEALTADICLGVSDTIVQRLKHSHKPSYFINHGLSRYFIESASERLSQLNEPVIRPAKKLVVGYVGNLLMEAPDRNIMRQVIKENPELNFVFWGQYEKNGDFVAYDDSEVFSFIDFLKAQPNVDLRGAVHPAVLNTEIKNVDIFWICWKINTGKIWDGSNSHKILEYLSTGRPVVSHNMSTYRNNRVIDMLDCDDNTGYPRLFSQVLERVKAGEPVSSVKERIGFAMANTYKAHIDEIEALVQPFCV